MCTHPWQYLPGGCCYVRVSCSVLTLEFQDSGESCARSSLSSSVFCSYQWRVSFFTLKIYLKCMSVCGYMHMSADALSDQKGAPGPLKLRSHFLSALQELCILLTAELCLSSSGEDLNVSW